MTEVQYLPDSPDTWLDTPCRAYLVYGEDAQSIREACDHIIRRRLAKDVEEFDLDVLDAEHAGAGAIIASVQREPMLGKVRVVLVHSCDVYRRREATREVEVLAKAVAALGERSCLILAVRPDPGGSRRGASIIHPRLDAAVRSVGMVVRCPLLTGSVLLGWIARYAANGGKRITRDAAARLAAKDNADRITLSRELDKLVAYVGERPRIELADVEAVATHDPEDVMFQLVAAVSERRAGAALQLLRTLAQYESRPQALAGRFLALLNRQLRLIYQMRELKESGVVETQIGKLPDTLRSQLPTDASITAMAWKARDYARDARLWSRGELVRVFEAIVRCDAANKGDESGSEDVLANLEALIVRACDRSFAAAQAE